MPHIADVLSLASDERVVILVRTHLLRLAWGLAMPTLLLIVPWFAFFRYREQALWMFVVGVMCVFVGAFWASHVFRRYGNTLLIITDRRMVDVEPDGRRRVVAETPLHAIRSVERLPRPWWAACLGMGSLRIIADAPFRERTLTHVPCPGRIASLLRGDHARV